VVGRRATREDLDDGLDGARPDVLLWLLIEAAHVPPPDILCFRHGLRDDGGASLRLRVGGRVYPVGQDGQERAVDFWIGCERAVGV